MKPIKFITLFLLFAANFCRAQDKPAVVTKQLFDTATDEVALGRLPGWYFHQGNDTAWAEPDAGVTSWRKMNPLDLDAKFADKHGKAEGWFRIKIRLDSTVNPAGLNLDYAGYAAVDVYIDGQLAASWGSTGLRGRPYAGPPTGILTPPAPVSLKRGGEFTLAMHVVDFLSPLPPRKLKKEVRLRSDIIYLGRTDSKPLLAAYCLNVSVTNTIWLSVIALLSLLAWLLFIQNRREKIFFQIALCSTFFAVNIYCAQNAFSARGESSLALLLYYAMQDFMYELILISVPVLLAGIFKRRLPAWLKIILLVIAVYGLVVTFLPLQAQALAEMPAVFLIGVSVYYIISSWRTLRGAQWAIIYGLLAAGLFELAVIAVHTFWPDQFYLGNWLTGAAILSFPLSLLVFVALRFKEMFHETKQKTDEVLRLSEEKKQEALNRQKLLQEEVDRQTAQIKADQTRLIQSEKMASLGELTAGIAHEIQNPLNFVNNFSEVSVELLGELKEEVEAGNNDDVVAIANNLVQNLEKIHHHGKRADSIVKGMLEHSRASTGQKELTDLNKLADEYLRLAYHGLRAKDKSFNAELVTKFDENLPKANIIPQDMGRVMLNLFNNAFYAVNQKVKTAGAGYKPIVEVSTAIADGQMKISVKDNGNGIPDNIKDKIMQPFFTTKPTGEGTGLGLSLSYDIVVKGHGGKIEVETEPGVYTEFTVTLPIR